MSETSKSSAPVLKEPGDDSRALLQHVTKSVILSYKRFTVKLSPRAGAGNRHAADLQLQNSSEFWMAFRFRCTHPDELEISPTPQFLIGPHQRQSLQISDVKDSSISSADKKINLVLEAAVCFQKRDDRRLLQSSEVWKQLPAKMITRVRFPIQVSSQQPSESDGPLIIECKENYSMVGKNYGERVKSVLSRIKRENLRFETFFILAACAGAGFTLGYKCPKC